MELMGQPLILALDPLAVYTLVPGNALILALDSLAVHTLVQGNGRGIESVSTASTHL